ncbi:MAG: 6-phosphofructokinase [Candidatus Korobacteraceae bacterium]
MFPQGLKPAFLLALDGVAEATPLHWVWQSFGFMSAVEKACECLRLLQTEAVSNPRLCVIQLFGSDSGFTVSHTALASLQCDAALIPEIQFDMERLFQHMHTRLLPRYRFADNKTVSPESPFGMIVMAETAVPEDWYRYVRWQEHLQRVGLDAENLLQHVVDPMARSFIQDQLASLTPKVPTVELSREEVEALILFVENGRRVYGETPDALRTASLRLVSEVLKYRIQHEMGKDAAGKDTYWKTFRVFTNEPRHLVRSSPPSANDIIIGRRFGMLAVDNAMAGYTDFMISQWLT